MDRKEKKHNRAVLRAIEPVRFQSGHVFEFRKTLKFILKRAGRERGVEAQGDVPEKTKLPFTFIALFPVVTLPVLLEAGP